MNGASRQVGQWVGRLFLLLAGLTFAVLGAMFVVFTITSYGDRNASTEDLVGGLPPIYVITALLTPPCIALAVGFWLYLVDTFRE